MEFHTLESHAPLQRVWYLWLRHGVCDRVCDRVYSALRARCQKGAGPQAPRASRARAASPPPRTRGLSPPASRLPQALHLPRPPAPSRGLPAAGTRHGPRAAAAACGAARGVTPCVALATPRAGAHARSVLGGPQRRGAPEAAAAAGGRACLRCCRRRPALLTPRPGPGREMRPRAAPSPLLASASYRAPPAWRGRAAITRRSPALPAAPLGSQAEPEERRAPRPRAAGAARASGGARMRGPRLLRARCGPRRAPSVGGVRPRREAQGPRCRRCPTAEGGPCCRQGRPAPAEPAPLGEGLCCGPASALPGGPFPQRAAGPGSGRCSVGAEASARTREGRDLGGWRVEVPARSACSPRDGELAPGSAA